ncbi:MAG: hypothetical protein Q8N91_07265, partial [Candidatus Omnitrophota bacterium]|nr:hypothetical protein [Candidatus Omnitrophota bacterium]
MEIGDAVRDIISVRDAERFLTGYMERGMKERLWGRICAPVIIPLFKGALFLARPFTRIFVEAAKEWLGGAGKRYIAGIAPQMTVKEGIRLLSDVFGEDFADIKKRFDEAKKAIQPAPLPIIQARPKAPGTGKDMIAPASIGALIFLLGHSKGMILLELLGLAATVGFFGWCIYKTYMSKKPPVKTPLAEVKAPPIVIPGGVAAPPAQEALYNATDEIRRGGVLVKGDRIISSNGKTERTVVEVSRDGRYLKCAITMRDGIRCYKIEPEDKEMRNFTALIVERGAAVWRPGRPRGPVIVEREVQGLLAGGTELRIYAEADENGREVAYHDLKQKGLAPAYKIQFGKEAYYLSEPFIADGGRVGFVAYFLHKPNNGKRPKLFVNGYCTSNSHGVWRAISHIGEGSMEGWFGKGFGQDSQTLPLEICEELTRIASSRAGLKRREGIFKEVLGRGYIIPDGTQLGTQFAQMQIDTERLVVADEVPLEGRQFGIKQTHIFEFDKGLRPDFKKGVGKPWQSKNPLYGVITHYCVRSVDGRIQYLFNSDGYGHMWIGSIQMTTGLLDRQGVCANQLTIAIPQILMTTPWQYYDEMPKGYTGRPHPDPVHARHYCDASAFLDKIDIIKEAKRMLPKDVPRAPPTLPGKGIITSSSAGLFIYLLGRATDYIPLTFLGLAATAGFFAWYIYRKYISITPPTITPPAESATPPAAGENELERFIAIKLLERLRRAWGTGQQSRIDDQISLVVAHQGLYRRADLNPRIFIRTYIEEIKKADSSGDILGLRIALDALAASLSRLSSRTFGVEAYESVPEIEEAARLLLNISEDPKKDIDLSLAASMAEKAASSFMWLMPIFVKHIESLQKKEETAVDTVDAARYKNLSKEIEAAMTRRAMAPVSNVDFKSLLVSARFSSNNFKDHGNLELKTILYLGTAASRENRRLVRRRPVLSIRARIMVLLWKDVVLALRKLQSDYFDNAKIMSSRAAHMLWIKAEQSLIVRYNNIIEMLLEGGRCRNIGTLGSFLFGWNYDARLWSARMLYWLSLSGNVSAARALDAVPEMRRLAEKEWQKQNEGLNRELGLPIAKLPIIDRPTPLPTTPAPDAVVQQLPGSGRVDAILADLRMQPELQGADEAELEKLAQRILEAQLAANGVAISKVTNLDGINLPGLTQISPAALGQMGLSGVGEDSSGRHGIILDEEFRSMLGQPDTIRLTQDQMKRMLSNVDALSYFMDDYRIIAVCGRLDSSSREGLQAMAEQWPATPHREIAMKYALQGLFDVSDQVRMGLPAGQEIEVLYLFNELKGNTDIGRKEEILKELERILLPVDRFKLPTLYQLQLYRIISDPDVTPALRDLYAKIIIKSYFADRTLSFSKHGIDAIKVCLLAEDNSPEIRARIAEAAQMMSSRIAQTSDRIDISGFFDALALPDNTVRCIHDIAHVIKKLLDKRDFDKEQKKLVAVFKPIAAQLGVLIDALKRIGGDHNSRVALFGAILQALQNNPDLCPSAEQMAVLNHVLAPEYAAGFVNRTFSGIARLAAQRSPEVISLDVVRSLELMMTRPGLGSYRGIVEAIKTIRERRPELIRNGGIAALISTMPEEVSNYVFSCWRVYYNPVFQQMSRQMSDVERYSLASASHNFLGQHGRAQSDQENISAAVRLLIEDWKDGASLNTPLFAGRNAINIVAEEMARQATPEELEREGGAGRIHPIYKSASLKGRALQDVIDTKDPLTIYLSGHGTGSTVGLEGGALDFMEMGDALSARGECGNVIIFVDSCFGYNFCINLLGYLYKKQSKTFPVMISSAHIDSQSHLYDYSEWVKKVQREKGTPLLLSDMADVVEQTLSHGFTSVFVPIDKSRLENFLRETKLAATQEESPEEAGARIIPEKIIFAPPTVIHAAVFHLKASGVNADSSSSPDAFEGAPGQIRTAVTIQEPDRAIQQPPGSGRLDAILADLRTQPELQGADEAELEKLALRILEAQLAANGIDVPKVTDLDGIALPGLTQISPAALGQMGMGGVGVSLAEEGQVGTNWWQETSQPAESGPLLKDLPLDQRVIMLAGLLDPEKIIPADEEPWFANFVRKRLTSAAEAIAGNQYLSVADLPAYAEIVGSFAPETNELTQIVKACPTVAAISFVQKLFNEYRQEAPKDLMLLDFIGELLKKARAHRDLTEALDIAREIFRQAKSKRTVGAAENLNRALMELIKQSPSIDYFIEALKTTLKINSDRAAFSLKIMEEESDILKYTKSSLQDLKRMNELLIDCVRIEEEPARIFIEGPNVIWAADEEGFGIANFVSKAMMTKMTPENIHELMMYARNVPGTTAERLEQNRKDALALTNGGLRDFIHDQEPGVNKAITALVRY